MSPRGREFQGPPSPSRSNRLHVNGHILLRDLNHLNLKMRRWSFLIPSGNGCNHYQASANDRNSGCLLPSLQANTSNIHVVPSFEFLNCLSHRHSARLSLPIKTSFWTSPRRPFSCLILRAFSYRKVFTPYIGLSSNGQAGKRDCNKEFKTLWTASKLIPITRSTSAVRAQCSSNKNAHLILSQHAAPVKEKSGSRVSSSGVSAGVR
jgi:hypothetical protein